MKAAISSQCASSVREACAETAAKADKQSAAPSSSACLSAVELFQDIAPAELEELNARLPLKKLQAGELLFDPTRAYQALFIVKSGRVRIFYLTAGGKAFTLSIIEKGGVFGEMPLIGQHLRDSYVEALDESEVCVLKEEDVKSFLLQEPRVAVRIAQILGRQVLELEQRLADLALKPLPQRLASLLLRLSKRPTFPWKRQHKTLSLTHEQLASLAGATREAVSKVLSDWATEGLILQARGRITILAEEQLHLRSRSQDI